MSYYDKEMFSGGNMSEKTIENLAIIVEYSVRMEIAKQISDMAIAATNKDHASTKLWDAHKIAIGVR